MYRTEDKVLEKDPSWYIVSHIEPIEFPGVRVDNPGRDRVSPLVNPIRHSRELLRDRVFANTSDSLLTTERSSEWSGTSRTGHQEAESR